MNKWRGKKVAILGWGIDSQDVEPWLAAQGAEITVRDEKREGKPFGDLSGYDVIVRSPGVYRLRPEIVEAGKNGVEITSKTKIFFDVCPAKIIGVTGTKGKGTTSTLIYEILKKGLPAGRQVFIGGNIGEGVFNNLEQMNKDNFVVLELSSFQLMDLTKSPHIAVVLMTTSEHLDWHKNVEEYIQAKGNITRWQTENDVVIANKDYENSETIGKLGRGKKVWVSGKDFTGEMKLRGEHNKENVAAAVAVARTLNIPDSIINEVVKNFKGLEHRLEEVATINGVTYYNDSFSTTPETAIAAIKAFTEPEIVILGGSDKGSNYAELGKTISEAQNIKAVILIGEMAKKIEIEIRDRDLKIIHGGRTMGEIVKQAKEIAKSGDVVVLSPACASFDMFKNYKERGRQFKEEVNKLLY